MELTREALLAAAASSTLPREQFEIPEFQITIWVRGMTGQERDEFERSNYIKRRGRMEPDLEKLGNARARLAVRCICNERGERLFTNEDAAVVGSWRADVLSRIYAAAQRLSNVTDEDLDELKKTSESAAGTGSSSS